jgi:hypothetical protein
MTRPATATSNSGVGTSNGGLFRLLRASSLMAVVIGAVGSVGLMLHAGHRNPSPLLLVLFTVWVLSPFAALLWANMASRRWSRAARAAVYCVTIFLTLASLAVYGNVVMHPPKSRAAFVWVVVPPASWVVLTIVISIAAVTSRRMSRRGARG